MESNMKSNFTFKIFSKVTDLDDTEKLGKKGLNFHLTL